jgi:hypothetical protein
MDREERTMALGRYVFLFVPVFKKCFSKIKIAMAKTIKAVLSYFSFDLCN